MSYHLVERPLRRWQWAKWRLLSIGYGVAASVAAYGLIDVMLGPYGRSLYLVQILELPTPTYLQKTWWEDRQTGQYLEKCHIKDAFRAEYINECLDGQDNGRRRVYLIGDSHARNFLPAVRAVFVDSEVHYLTMGSSCGFTPPELAAELTGVNCPGYVEATYRFLIEHLHSGDVVVVGQSLQRDERRQTPLYFNFIKTFAKAIANKHTQMVLLDDIVPPARDPTECFDVPWRTIDAMGCAVARLGVESAYKRFDQLALAASREIPNFYYAEIRVGLCNYDQCGQRTLAGTPIWHDHGHITEAASSELSPLLRTALEEHGFPIVAK
jgi:hypothetical protein